MKTAVEELALLTDLPSPRGVGLAILDLTRGEDFRSEDLATLIEGDPALAARLIKLANSASHAGVADADVRQAVMRVGAVAVRNLALGFSLLSNSRAGACRGFDYDRFWSESFLRAVTLRRLSVQARHPRAAEHYVLGLLSGMGRLGLATVHPRSYASILEDGPYADEHALAQVEKKAYELDHRELGGWMLRDWSMPDTFAVAVENATRPLLEESGLAAEALTLARRLRIAIELSRLFLAEGEEAAQAAILLRRAVERAGVDPESLLDDFEELVREWTEWRRETRLPIEDGLDLEACRRLVREGPKAAPGPLRSPRSRPTGDVVDAPDDALRLVVVDDDEATREACAQRARSAGFEVFSAASGRDALELFFDRSPEVLIADGRMPEMDGIELVRELRRCEEGEGVYVIVLTPGEDADLVDRAYEAGGNDHVAKPFPPRALDVRLGAAARAARLLRENERERLGFNERIASLAIEKRRLARTSLTDALTGLHNRRFAMERLAELWDAGPLSLVMFDLDHFKRVNDTWGHDGGDVVLQRTARVATTVCGPRCFPCRVGGEEFLVLCPGQGIEEAASLAERLRVALSDSEVEVGEGSVRVTASFGVATRTDDVPDAEALLKAADEASYRAKQGGRDRVERQG